MNTRPARPPQTRTGVTRALAAVGLAAVLTSGLAACTSGSSKGVGDVDVATVLEAQVAQTGVLADAGSLDCDDAKVTQGATVECSFTSDGVPVGLTATVTSVEGSTLGLDVATTARPVPADVLGDAVAVQVGKQLGAAVDGTTCAGDLQPEVGQSATCTVTSGSQTQDVTVTVTSVDGGQTEYSMVSA